MTMKHLGFGYWNLSPLSFSHFLLGILYIISHSFLARERLLVIKF